jgi:transcriptional regulator with XRE-family HTH domain
MIKDVKAHPEAGRRVLLARLEAGLSQRALAEKSGVDQSTIVRVERGEGGVRPMTLAKLAKALDMPVEELLEG